ADELTRLREEVARTIAGRTLRVQEGRATRTVDEQQRAVIVGMLDEPAGLFDEGLRTEGSATYRVLNAPGLSTEPEIEAARRLLFDIATFVPRRFEFSYAFPGHGDYAFDLVFD